MIFKIEFVYTTPVPAHVVGSNRHNVHTEIMDVKADNRAAALDVLRDVVGDKTPNPHTLRITTCRKQAYSNPQASQRVLKTYGLVAGSKSRYEVTERKLVSIS